MIKIVYATAENGAFGLEGRLPWGHCPEDLMKFKKETEGCVLFMGANTFKSLPKKLAGRLHVVVEANPDSTLVTKSGDRPDIVFSGPVDNALAEMADRDIAIIGGSNLIMRCINKADQIVETEHNGEYPADVFVMHDRLWLKMNRRLTEETKYDTFTVRKYVND